MLASPPGRRGGRSITPWSVRPACVVGWWCKDGARTHPVGAAVWSNLGSSWVPAWWDLSGGLMHCRFFWLIRSSASVAMTVLAVVVAPSIAEAGDFVEIRPLPKTSLPSVQVVPVAGRDVSIPACRGLVWQRFDAESNAYLPISLQPCDVMAPASALPKDGRRFTVDAGVVDGDVVRAVVVVGAKCTSGQVFSLANCSSVVAVEGPTITVRLRQE